MTIETKHFKEILLKEKKTLEGELPTVGRKNPDNSSDWEAVEPEVNNDSADVGDVAEGIEEFENNSGVLDQLEKRLNEVKKALEKIEDEKYGVCEVGGEEIEEDRLLANPAATTCKKHMGA